MPANTSSHVHSSTSLLSSAQFQEEITIQHTLPMVGSYIVFQLDIPATLDGLDTEQVLDPTLRSLAQQAPRRKYVGYVEQCLTSDLWSPWRAFRIRPLSRGLPYTNNARCITPDMCVPVYPTTFHPTSRRPLHPTKPLPWQDAYHHTCTPDIICRVRTAYASASTAAELPITDRKRYQMLRGFDSDRRDKKLIRQRQSVATYHSDSINIEQLMATAEATNFEGFDLDDDDESLYSDDEEDADGFYHVKSKGIFSDWIYNDYRTDGEKMQTLPAVDVSYDVWSVSHMPDPSNLQEEFNSLIRLVDNVTRSTAESLPSPSRATESDKSEYGLLKPKDKHLHKALPDHQQHSAG
ncbi:hypothetical protein AX16_006733 [Volvariella volvacea WC 439]|nr:hypothetical protein AX16_006733 [Volvariella volvacea WC 439]